MTKQELLELLELSTSQFGQKEISPAEIILASEFLLEYNFEEEAKPALLDLLEAKANDKFKTPILPQEIKTRILERHKEFIIAERQRRERLNQNLNIESWSYVDPHEVELADGRKKTIHVTRIKESLLHQRAAAVGMRVVWGEKINDKFRAYKLVKAN